MFSTHQKCFKHYNGFDYLKNIIAIKKTMNTNKYLYRETFNTIILMKFFLGGFAMYST